MCARRRREGQKSRSQERIAARKEAMSKIGGRNDAKLFAGVFALFFLPPAAILLWAFSSGYLDKLANSY